MKDKLNQFIDNVNGQFIEVSYKDAIYQCMDLAYLWVFCLGFPKATIQHTYAYQVYTNPNDLTKEYFDLIPKTSTAIPQDGDIGVWDKTSSNKAGHIALALGGGTINSCMWFEQNNPLGTNAHIQSRNYTNILGWLRPKIKEVSNEMENIKKFLLEKGLEEGKLEGAIREMWEKWRLFPEREKEIENLKDVKEEMMSDIYKGKDLNNKESVKVCIDTWKDVIDGKYIKKEDCDRIKKEDIKKEVDNALKEAKKDWKVVELQNQVQEYEEIRKTTAYKVAVTIAEILQALKIIKKEK